MGVTYLLDTHIIVWLAGHGGPTPRHEVREALDNSENTLLISAVSAFEVSTKVRLGKFESARGLFDRWDVVAPSLGAQPIELAERAALVAGRLEWQHKNPFDRLLAGQAITEGLTLITADQAFESAPGLSLLRW